MNKRLEESIQNLYEVFSIYHGNFQMRGSFNYGESVQRWNESLFSKPLVVLTSQDLSRFTGKTITTWGDVDDFKHFLPRIFELTAEYDTPYEIWITFQKLELANWGDWKVIEKDAIVNYLESLFDNLLSDGSDFATASFINYFTSIASIHQDFTKLLEMFEADKSEAKYMHLANLVVEQGDLIIRKGKVDGFFKTSKNAVELKNWLLREELVEELTSVFFYAEDEKISWAEQILSYEIECIEKDIGSE